MLSQRIAKDVNIFAKGGSDAMSSAARFGTDIRFFEDSQRRLERKSRRGGRLSNFAKARVAKMSKEFKRMNTTVLDILNNAQEIGEAQHSSQYIFQQSDTLLAEAGQLVQAYLELEGERKKLNVLSYALGFFAIVFVFLLGAKLVADARRREEVSAEQNRHTQDAILKLLDEMGSLADGDLTIQPEVTEQITGAIADSVNFAVREMRALVERIKNAAHQVAAASEQSRQTATELTETTLRQAAQITETTNKMRDMATSMAEMSQSAERSAEVAQGSLETARRGSEAVQSTIHGMDEMREQIQETAKRIKRLGESSQQIGEIVELINDIAEQTNILSLNAAIQAAMAGEAGRGFAVVADEVQRLAERSAEATRQIADLVKTIQADTNEAVASMEKATNGVVETTRLADAAGQALGEIESVSEQLSSLIVDIAHRAQHHSEIATVMSGSMIEIQEATTMTSHGTRETADSIGKLSDLARELQASVAGFKLPT